MRSVPARQKWVDHHDEPGVSVNDDLAVGGVPAVLRLLGHCLVMRRDEGSVHDEDRVLAKPSARPEREEGPEVVDDAVGRGLRDAEQRGRAGAASCRSASTLRPAEPGPPTTSSTAGPAALRLLPRGAARSGAYGNSAGSAWWTGLSRTAATP